MAYGRCPPTGLQERHAYKRYTSMRDTPVRDTPVRDTPVRDTPVRLASLRDTPVRRPIRDARLWEIYAYEIAVYGIYTP